METIKIIFSVFQVLFTDYWFILFPFLLFGYFFIKVWFSDTFYIQTNKNHLKALRQVVTTILIILLISLLYICYKI
jgi:hypothetical protein